MMPQISVKLNQISSEALKKNKASDLSPFPYTILIHTNAYVLIPFCTSAFRWHWEPKHFISMQTQSEVAPAPVSLIVF